MAAIDKTYVNASELRSVIEWAKNIDTVILPNGYKFKPLDYIYSYNDLDNPDFDWNREEYVLWNTPLWFDRWLWNNCPFDFIKDRLKFQYSEKTLDYWSNNKLIWNDPKNNFDFGKQHYTFLKYPKWNGCKWWMNNGRKDYPWYGKRLTYIVEIISPSGNWEDDLKYDDQTNNWYPDFGEWPHYCKNNDYVWNAYHKRIPNKKSIIRELRKWYIPKGYIVKIYNIRYKNFDFEILVK